MSLDRQRTASAARRLLIPLVILGITAAGLTVAAAASPSSARVGAHPQKGGSGVLTGSLASGPTSVDLTEVGNEDWAVWGFAAGGTSTSLAPDVRKSGGSAISDLTDVNPLSLPLRGLGQFQSPPFVTGFRFSWSNGGSDTSETDVLAGLQHVPQFFVDSTGTGFSFTVPAEKTKRTLKVYVHSDEGTGRLTATLSDGSAAPFTDTALVPVDLNTPGVYTLTYAAASAGQHLTVNFVLDHPGPAGFSVQPNVAIYAAALSRPIHCPKGFMPASATNFPDADRNGDGFVCVHAIDNTG